MYVEKNAALFTCKLILYNDKRTAFNRGNLGKRGVIRAPACTVKFTDTTKKIYRTCQVSNKQQVLLPFVLVIHNQDIQNPRCLRLRRSLHTKRGSKEGNIDIPPTLLRLSSTGHSEHKARMQEIFNTGHPYLSKRMQAQKEV